MISTKQRIWDWIRRTKMFQVRDMMGVQMFSYQTYRNFLIPLEIAGVIKVHKKDKFVDKIYYIEGDILKEVKAPCVNIKGVYLYKRNWSCDVGARSLMIKAIKNSSQNEIGKVCNIDKSSMSLLVNNKYPNPSHMYKKIRDVLDV